MDLLPRRHRYKPHRFTSDGTPKYLYGHAHPGFPTIYYNPDKSRVAQVRTVVHEALHAWELYWWREYKGEEGPPEKMVRRLEACIYDMLMAFTEQEETHKQ